MSLRIIATGGTFDKHYDPIAGALGFAESHLPQLLAQARLDAPVALQTLMLIDSLDMTDTHRRTLLEACRASPQAQIVVIHGTDTLVESARLLGQAALPATVVFTGAMVPAEIEGSDALFNLGFAVACARALPAGVYVAMNARIHPWDQVRKNRALGRFEKDARA